MKSQHIAMTGEEFHRLPRKMGWKYEYWEGKAHISPNWLSVVTTQVCVEPRTIVAPCPIRPISEQDSDKFIPAYVAGFLDSMDYCDCSRATVEKAATNYIRNYFTGRRGLVLPASQVAVSRGHIVGAAMIVEKKNQGCLLDLLFVRPHWRRKGLATALVATALNSLHGELHGELHREGWQRLTSLYRLGNEQSRAWHHRFGFEDVIDVTLARAHYYDWLQIIEQLDELALPHDDHYASCIKWRDYWEQKVESVDDFPASYAWL